jgi:hypothetical protein
MAEVLIIEEFLVQFECKYHFCNLTILLPRNPPMVTVDICIELVVILSFVGPRVQFTASIFYTSDFSNI